MTPSRKGRTVRIPSCALPCICCATLPMAISLSVRLSKATTEGSSTTILSFQMIIVLAVPKSIAISCVREKSPIIKIS